MTDATVPAGKLDIGRVIQETFGVIGRNFVTFAVLSLVLAGIPTAVIGVVQAAAFQGGTTQSFSTDQFASSAMAGLAAMMFSAILQGALIHATVQDLNGERPTIAASLATGLRAFLPLIGVSLLFAIAVVCGFVLLVVPGLIAITVWCVAVPALVAERTGVFGAFSRSRDLTRGSRWRILALALIVWVATALLGQIMLRVMGVDIMSANTDVAAIWERALNPVSIAVNLVINTLTSLLIAAGTAVLYVELRKIRDGHGGQWLSEIFG
jgi:hypothetical protein